MSSHAFGFVGLRFCPKVKSRLVCLIKYQSSTFLSHAITFYCINSFFHYQILETFVCCFLFLPLRPIIETCLYITAYLPSLRGDYQEAALLSFRTSCIHYTPTTKWRGVYWNRHGCLSIRSSDRGHNFVWSFSPTVFHILL